MKTDTYTLKRKRLMLLADQRGTVRILYVQAPAGYGKTVFGGHWLNAQTQPRAMLTLDEYDNSLYGLCHKLSRGLAELCPGNAAVLSFTEHPAFDNAPGEFLMRAASSVPGSLPASLVIDDYHNITDPSVQKLLPIFLKRLPASTKILILSRTAPPEVFSGLVLKHDLLLIGQEQMRFDSSEIRALYRENGTGITPVQAESIYHFTEGWPIEVNALMMSGVVPKKGMTPVRLESFIKTQIWETWDESLRDFMVATSMEEELDGALCDCLTGGSGGEAVLDQLLARGAFLVRNQNGSYRFHKLFREFLQKQFRLRPAEYRKNQYRLAGNYYLEQKDFYRAIQRFSQIGDTGQIARCFDLLEHIDRSGFDTERVMLAVKEHVDGRTAAEYPFLYFMLAFTARNEGRIEDFIRYADQYYANYPRVVERNPELAHNIFFLYMMDFRYTLQDIAGIASGLPAGGSLQGVRGSATSYFPLYHRSYKDFSELARSDIDSGAAALDRQLGALLGGERAMLLECLRAGLYYEKGELSRAKELILSASAKLQSGFAPESKFCVLMLLTMVQQAMGQPAEAAATQQEIQGMIEEDKAFYLQYNFDAMATKHRLSSGDACAAQTWLGGHETEVCAQAEFFRLYGLFTTARAYITSGCFDKAVILLQKLNTLCSAMNRPLDCLEAELLLAVCYWKKKRGYQGTALGHLEQAVRIAQPYGYEQAFVNDGAELKTMLSHLKTRTIRSDYRGKLSGPFVSRLCLAIARNTVHREGLTGGRMEQGLRFTGQQKRVMRLLCEGNSYRLIGETLGIKYSTVRSHIELIYKKLDVSGVKEAILKIQELNLLEQD